MNDTRSSDSFLPFYMKRCQKSQRDSSELTGLALGASNRLPAFLSVPSLLALSMSSTVSAITVVLAPLPSIPCPK